MINAQEALERLDEADRTEREANDQARYERECATMAPEPSPLYLPESTSGLVELIIAKVAAFERGDRSDEQGFLNAIAQRILAMQDSIAGLERVAQQRLEHASAEVERRRQATMAFGRMQQALGFSVEALRPFAQLASVAPDHRKAAAERLFASPTFLEHAATIVAMHDALSGWSR